MAYTGTSAQNALADRVRVKMDALEPAGGAVVGSTAETYAAAEQAADDIILMAPRQLVFPLRKDWAEQAGADYEDGTVPLPLDFLRLLSLEVDGYAVPVSHEDLVNDDGDAYRAYLRGEREASTDYPAAFRIPYRSDQNAYTEAVRLFPEGGASVSSFLYVARTKPESIGAPLMEPMLWRAASYLLTALDPEMASLAEANAAKALEGRASRSVGRDSPRQQRTISRPYRPLGF